MMDLFLPSVSNSFLSFLLTPRPLFLSVEAGSPVHQTSLKLVMHPRMTLNSSLSYLCPFLSTGIQVYRHALFIRCWKPNPGFHAC